MKRRAFTLVELLVVVVIIGILAAIAIPKFASTKEKAYVATMKSDLRNVIAAQAAYYSDQRPPAYAATGAALGSRFQSSAGVTVTFGDVSATGYNATATHTATGSTCVVYQGAAVLAPATVEGVIACD